MRPFQRRADRGPVTLWACLTSTSIIISACGSIEDQSVAWEGSVDTLSTGEVVIRNTGGGLWGEGEEWGVTELTRIGSVVDDGPAAFGQIRSVELDGANRIWILDGQANEIRVFDLEGNHVRTVGRAGEGPGEFSGPVRLDLAPDGHLWVMDSQNGRLSRFDTTGAYVDGWNAPGGFMQLPWPGGFDELGRYHSPVPRTTPEFHMALGRYDSGFNAVDTLTPPQETRTRSSFTIEQDGLVRVAAGVPFTGSLVWRLSPDGTFLALVTDEYRLFELAANGDTVRTIHRAFDPIPVTASDIDAAIADLAWFTDQGGEIDRSEFPSQKPGAVSFFLDDDARLWVAPVNEEYEAGVKWEVFSREGQLLGGVELPFALEMSPVPRVRDGILYGVTTDDLDVPYAVVARIER